MNRQTGPSPLYGRYLVGNFLGRLYLRTLDGLLSIMHPNKKHPPIQAPRRLLLCNGAHLGDVVNATAVIDALKTSFPGLHLGFLAGSWALPVIERHPRIDIVHTFNHWKLNRGRASWPAKLYEHAATGAAALREIRSQEYDTAIDLYPYYPNSIPIIAGAGVPVRIGYRSGGCGPLLTHALDWRMSDRHVTDYHVDLLGLLPGLRPPKGKLRAEIAPIAPDTVNPLREKGRLASYIVCHPGSGAPERLWPVEHWVNLCRRLVDSGYGLVFTGRGDSDRRITGEIVKRLGDGVRDLCDRLDWPVFVKVLSEARLIIAVESLAGHLAAALDRPCVSIYSGITSTSQWRPLATRCEVLTSKPSCAPCFRSGGCETMKCLVELHPGRVLEAALRLLNDPGIRDGPGE